MLSGCNLGDFWVLFGSNVCFGGLFRWNNKHAQVMVGIVHHDTPTTITTRPPPPPRPINRVMGKMHRKMTTSICAWCVV